MSKENNFPFSTLKSNQNTNKRLTLLDESESKLDFTHGEITFLIYIYDMKIEIFSIRIKVHRNICM